MTGKELLAKSILNMADEDIIEMVFEFQNKGSCELCPFKKACDKLYGVYYDEDGDEQYTNQEMSCYKVVEICLNSDMSEYEN